MDQPAALLEMARFQARLARRRARASLILLLSWWLFAGLGALWGDLGSPVLLGMGAVSHAALHGEPWRLLAAAFLHLGLLHLVGNSLALRALGPFLERFLGTARFLIVYAASGLVAGLASALLCLQEPARLSVGASGAILGIFGAIAALLLRPDGRLPGPLLAHARRRMAINTALVAAISLLPGVDLAAHAGGFLAGFLLGLAPPLRRGLPRVDRPLAATPGDPVWLRPAAGAAILLLVAAPLLALAHGHPWTPPAAPALVPRPLPGGGPALALPPDLEPRLEGGGAPGERTWLGTSGDGLLLLAVHRYASGPADARSALPLLRARAEARGETAEFLEIAGRPGLHTLGPANRGRVQEEWIVALPDALLRLELVRPVAGPGWAELGRRMLAPLRP